MIGSHHEMHWCGSGFEMFPVDKNRPWVLQTSKNFGVEHGGRKGPLAPLLEHLDQGVSKRIATRVRRNSIPTRCRDGLCDAFPGGEGGARGSSTAIEEDHNIRDGPFEESLYGRPSIEQVNRHVFLFSGVRR